MDNRLNKIRKEMNLLRAEWTAMGGLAILPTVEQRLKEKREPLARPKLYIVPKAAAPAPRKASPPKMKKRRLAARG
jgi:hypothetical protein